MRCFIQSLLLTCKKDCLEKRCVIAERKNYYIMITLTTEPARRYNKFITISAICTLLMCANIYSQEKLFRDSIGKAPIHLLSLQDCLKIADEHSHEIKASEADINSAAALKKQAEAGYYPQVSINAEYSLMNKDPLFILPSFSIPTPTIALGSYNINLGSYNIPEEDVKLMDKQNIHGTIGVIYPIYTGGRVQSLNKEASGGYKIARDDARKVNLQVKYDVVRYYYAVVLAKNIYKLGKNALDRLNVTLALTENMYKNGSGKVTKVDYLRNKIIVNQVQSMVFGFKENVENSKQALRFALGNSCPDNFDIKGNEIPFANGGLDTAKIFAEAYKNNPDWSKIKTSEKIFSAKINDAESGYFPNVALFANFDQNFNSYKYGITNKVNSTLWTVGVGVQIPVFSGFYTSGKVSEAKAGLEKIREEKYLLHDALMLKIKLAYNKIIATARQVLKLREAKNTSEENLDLNERAFQAGMVEAKDLIEAQIINSIIKAQYEKALYDHLIAQADLNLLTGANTLY